MDILKRIDELREQKGWTIFELTNRANLSEYTIYSWYKRGSKPTVYALENVCEALGITMQEFFAEVDEAVLSADQIQLLRSWDQLTPEQRDVVLRLMKSYQKTE